MSPVKVARTYLYAGWLGFEIAFFDSKNLTDLMIFGILNKEWSNFQKLLSIFLLGIKTFEISAHV